MLDEVERSGARRVQTARAWPRAAQQIKIKSVAYCAVVFIYAIINVVVIVYIFACIAINA